MITRLIEGDDEEDDDETVKSGAKSRSLSRQKAGSKESLHKENNRVNALLKLRAELDLAYKIVTRRDAEIKDMKKNAK